MKEYDRLPKESARAYEAFKAYCDLGAERSLRRAGQKLSKNHTTVSDWSKKYNWVGRARAWDAAADERERKAKDDAMKKEADKWAKRQMSVREDRWTLGDELLAKAKAMLAYPISKQTASQDGKAITINPQKFSFGSVARMVEIGDKLRGLAAGVATDKIEHVGADNQPLQGVTGQIVILELPPGRIAEDGKDNE